MKLSIKLSAVFLILVLAFSVVQFSLAHGNEEHTSENTDKNNDDDGLTLNQILLITIGAAFLLLGMLYIVGVRDKRLLITILISALVLLILDFVFQKYVYYA